jgi:hypothetical protein
MRALLWSELTMGRGRSGKTSLSKKPRNNEKWYASLDTLSFEIVASNPRLDLEPFSLNS